MKNIFGFITLTLIFAFSLVNSNAQVKVSLKVDESVKSARGELLFCDKDFKCGLTQNENEKTSLIGKDEVLMKVWRTGKDFYFLIDANNNKKITDEKKILLQNNSIITVKLKKTLAPGKVVFLPFEISHQTYEKKGVVMDSFLIIPHYVDGGTLSYKNCSSNIALSDMNFDGKFDISEAKFGTNFHIDRNNDGKFWGKEEHNKTNEIIEFCGQNFLISSLDNKSLTLMPTNLNLAKVGEATPEFTFTSLKGEVFDHQKLKGQFYLFDFWASWCVPCVENLPQIKSIEKENPNLIIFSINVDEKARKDLVVEILDRFDLNKNAVIRGLGEEDDLWKTFGGVNNNHSIPLYVLTDKDGIIKYSGAGGKDLIDLKTELKKITEE